MTGAPDHPRAPEALLAMANCQAEMKDTSGARGTLDDLVKAYPKSEAAAGRQGTLACAEVGPLPKIPRCRNPTCPALAPQVLWAAFALGVAFGAIAQRTHFCTMGAVADIVNMGDWTRMRMWVLAIGVAMLGFNAMVAAGLGRGRATRIYAAPRADSGCPRSSAALLFGFGMVLASGCGSKTLVRIGGGNLKSLVVLAGAGRGGLRHDAWRRRPWPAWPRGPRGR